MSFVLLHCPEAVDDESQSNITVNGESYPIHIKRFLNISRLGAESPYYDTLTPENEAEQLLLDDGNAVDDDDISLTDYVILTNNLTEEHRLAIMGGIADYILRPYNLSGEGLPQDYFAQLEEQVGAGEIERPAILDFADYLTNLGSAGGVVIPVGSSGNFNVAPDGTFLDLDPFPPALWPNVLSVGGHFAETGYHWPPAHKAQVSGPAIWIPVFGASEWAAGTSFSAALESALIGVMVSTDSCDFVGNLIAVAPVGVGVHYLQTLPPICTTP
jgi:hypothetical protein